MDDKDFVDAVKRIDWSSLSHAYGTAEDMPGLWETYLREGDPAGEFANTICHQSTVYEATRALPPILIELAKSSHPRRATALSDLGAILGSPGGPLRDKQAMADRPFKNPLTGKMWHQEPPDPVALRAETEWVEGMQQLIEESLDDWLEAADSDDDEVRLAALAILAASRRHARSGDARALVRSKLASVDDGHREWLESLLSRS